MRSNTIPRFSPPPPHQQNQNQNQNRLKVEKDRLNVTMQPLPRDAPPLPAAKLLVTATPYDPQAAGKSVGAEVAM
jgi:hypothetical protein